MNSIWQSWLKIFYQWTEMTIRQLDSLFAYCHGLVASAGKHLLGGEVFVKVLTDNDDSGRHGVLIPTEAYELFPELVISDRNSNATTHFKGFDCIAGQEQKLAYKYYQRYPERRITCLNSVFNDRQNGFRVAVFLKAEHRDGTIGYYTDLVREHKDYEFQSACLIFYGNELVLSEGLFSLRSVDATALSTDEALNDLLQRFDKVSEMGWIESMRVGDTGIGYTFETLVGVEENNDRRADFRGIEIKTTQVKMSGGRSGKINLFQQAPKWESKLTAVERLRMIGQLNENGRYACYSQVTTTPNNLDLWLSPNTTPDQIDLLKHELCFGHWPLSVLAERLREKHSRAVFVKGEVSNTSSRQRFRYKELVYCEQPSIKRFNDLVQNRRILFEFLMSENEVGRVRNHGYPWRLSSDDYLSDLYSLKVKLR